MRRRYLLCYDIRDTRRLRETHQTVKGFGEPLQYSVFVCDLSDAERIKMIDRLRAVIDERTDSIMIVDLGETGPGREGRQIRWLGTPPALPQRGASIL